jgi:hypothetical protein
MRGRGQRGRDVENIRTCCGAMGVLRWRKPMAL